MAPSRGLYAHVHMYTLSGSANCSYLILICTCLALLRGSFGLHNFGQQEQSELYHIEPLSRDNREVRGGNRQWGKWLV